MRGASVERFPRRPADSEAAGLTRPDVALDGNESSAHIRSHVTRERECRKVRDVVMPTMESRAGVREIPIPTRAVATPRVQHGRVATHDQVSESPIQGGVLVDRTRRDAFVHRVWPEDSDAPWRGANGAAGPFAMRALRGCR